MLFTVPFSAAFWGCYLGGGLSDILDGLCARILRQQSETGARLDSAADLIFGFALGLVVIINIRLPAWIWVCAACAAGLRLAGYIIGAYKYHAFSPLHTYANKAAGICLFAFPLLYEIFGLNITGALLCSAAFVSAAEEVIITIRSKSLNRDHKGLLFQ